MIAQPATPRATRTASCEAERFPAQILRSMQDGANHLGGDESTPDVDPEREFMPAGQGVGAIDDLVPAADLVHRIVDEAESVLGEAARPDARRRPRVRRASPSP